MNQSSSKLQKTLFVLTGLFWHCSHRVLHKSRHRFLGNRWLQSSGSGRRFALQASEFSDLASFAFWLRVDDMGNLNLVFSLIAENLHVVSLVFCLI